MLKKIFKLRNITIICTVILTSISLMGTANANFWSAISATYTASGKIVNQNQEPMEGVVVLFVSDGLGIQSRGVTDSMGNYMINPPAKTSGTVTVSKVGYRIINERRSELCSAGSTMVFNYALHPDWISGKITIRSGEPLEGVKITFEQDGGLTGVQIAFTDSNGNYKYTVPKDGENYWITITKEGYQTVRERWYLYGGQVYNRQLQ